MAYGYGILKHTWYKKSACKGMKGMYICEIMLHTIGLY